jgi:RimJ/RimL family protein N-acetyltransferase
MLSAWLRSPARFDHVPFGLRPWGGLDGDAAALAAAWADPDVARWTEVPGDGSLEVAERWIAGQTARMAEGRVLDLVVYRDDHGYGPVGEVGLVAADEEHALVEVGWWLSPSARGRGLATAAVDLVTSWVLSDDVGARTAYALVHPDNPRSIAVAERAGYRAAGPVADGREVYRRDAIVPEGPGE